MLVALFPNLQKKPSKDLAIGICEFLHAHHFTVVADDEEAKQIGAHPLSKYSLKDIKFLISMGGDGSILRLVHEYPDLNAPILGINLGHLGFMADVPTNDLYPSLQDLVSGLYKIEERLVMEAETHQGEQLFAVNDIVVHRGKNPSLIELAIHVDGVYVNTFIADGLIIATPNGSTAYSLAAGGPILSPDLEAIVITPICPHTISNRPIVLTGDVDIQIQCVNKRGPAELHIDGLESRDLSIGDVLHVSKSSKKFRLVNLHRRDYFSTLRTKLGWSGKLPLGIIP